MGRSLYHLQTLFDLRETKKKKSEDEFLRSRQLALQELKTLTEIRNSLKKSVEIRKQTEITFLQMATGGNARIKDLQIQKLHIDQLKDREKKIAQKIVAHEKIVEEANKKVKLKSEEMIAKSAEFEVVVKLKNKWRTQLENEIAKKDEDRLEDIATFNFNAKETPK